MSLSAVKELLYKMADDQLIIGHRHSEWTGLGPLLEEDIAFSSMAQDKIGQSQALYSILEQLGEPPPDTVAFMRPASEFRNCVFVELPNGEYDFSLVRHFFYDTALALRFDMLVNSSFTAMAELSVKIRGELKYHTLHANTWIRQLGSSASTESIARMQTSLDYALPYALGMFERSPFEEALVHEKIFQGESALQERWQEKVSEILATTKLKVPDWKGIQPVIGGRSGKHSEHLQPLLDEMSEVFRTDPNAEW
jgi:ring-1,2-phenylacetyl-CoA epoxidase subunit PaaC